MATAENVVTRALNYLLVQSSEQPVQASEFVDSIDTLNDMMTEWAGVGINIGYTLLESPADVVTVPDSTLGAIKFNLAMRLAAEYDATPSQFLSLSADNSFTNLLNQTISVEAACFPDTLPIGSGNECLNNQRFFPTPADELATEDGGSIILESDV